MTKSELLQTAKPILFNTDMVRAILEGRKTVTRRIVKKEKADAVLNSPARKENPDIPDGNFIKCLVNSPYQKEDILYVRETWAENAFGGYFYRADGEFEVFSWKPSIHMPKEATRLFLKVTDVRVERLQDMDKMDAVKEGTNIRCCVNLMHALTKFKKLWNSTIKKQDLDLYGWDANPWVWVIEFERIL